VRETEGHDGKDGVIGVIQRGGTACPFASEVEEEKKKGEEREIKSGQARRSKKESHNHW